MSESRLEKCSSADEGSGHHAGLGDDEIEMPHLLDCGCESGQIANGIWQTD